MNREEKSRKTVSRRVMHHLKSQSPDSICGLLGKIYYSSEDEETRLDCRKAVRMAKRMASKLRLIKATKG
jgi:hypothetical protein